MLNVINEFSIFGLHITFYGVLVSLAMAAGVFVAAYLAKYRKIKGDDIYLLALYILPLSIIGARLYYVIFSSESYTFLEIFKIWEGGLAVYGGIIGGAFAVLLFVLIHKKSFFAVADVCAIGLILGQAIGRIGCYFGGCCYGVEVTNPSFMWFPFAVLHGTHWHYSTFFYESFLCFVCFFVFLYLIKKKVRTNGVMLSLYLMCYGIIRFFIEGFRGDSLYIGSFKVSQLLSLVIVLLGVVLLIYLCKKRNINGADETNLAHKDSTIYSANKKQEEIKDNNAIGENKKQEECTKK